MLFLKLFFFISISIYSEKINFWKAIELAKKDNPDIIAKRYEIDKARSDIITAGLKPNPIFNNQILYQTKSEKPGGVLSAGNRQDWFQFTQAIPVANQIQNAIDFAKKNTEVAKQTYLETERNMLFLVLTKWLEVWYFREKIRSYALAKEFLDDLINTSDKKNKNKVYIEIELKRTKILSKQFEIMIDSLNQYAENSEESLRYLLAREEKVEIDDKDFFKVKIHEVSLANHIQFALKKRSDMNLAIGNKSASISKLRLEESNAYPRPEVGVLYNPQNRDQYVGTFFQMPIPINNKNQGNISKAKSDLKQSEAELSVKEKAIQVEIVNAFREYNLFRKNFESYEALAYDADEIRNKLEESYLKGKTSYVDYLEAQNDWFELRIAQFESYFSLKRSYLNFIYLTGLIQE